MESINHISKLLAIGHKSNHVISSRFIAGQKPFFLVQVLSPAHRLSHALAAGPIRIVQIPLEAVD